MIAMRLENAGLPPVQSAAPGRPRRCFTLAGAYLVPSGTRTHGNVPSTPPHRFCLYQSVMTRPAVVMSQRRHAEHHIRMLGSRCPEQQEQMKHRQITGPSDSDDRRGRLKLSVNQVEKWSTSRDRGAPQTDDTAPHRPDIDRQPCDTRRVSAGN
jgi:hypothetical protein